jgi:7-cyano-7-deazaguanine synthase in queuosine biosynthesis
MATAVLALDGLATATLIADVVVEAAIPNDTMVVSLPHGLRHQEGTAQRVSAHFGLNWYSFDVPQLWYSSDPMIVVPFRDSLLAGYAIALAAQYAVSWIALPGHASAPYTWTTPDYMPECVGGLASAAVAGTNLAVRVRAPYAWMTKADIVRWAAVLRAPLWLSWSCYINDIAACGVCPSCLERIAAFTEAGFIDPISYAIQVAWPQGIAEFPR